MEKPKSGVFNRRLLVIFLIVFVQVIGGMMVLPILPLYAEREFGMTAATITLLNTSYFLAQFLAGPVLGRLSDKYGRIPILLISQIGTVISLLMLGFANSVWLLFAGRILDGLTGGNYIVAQAYAADVTPAKNRTQVFGYIFLAFGLGFVVGPAMGGILSSYFGYHMPYIVAAVASAIVVLMTYFMLEESITPDKAKHGEEKHKSMAFSAIMQNLPLISIVLIAFGAQFAFSMLQSTFSLFGKDVLFADNPQNAELGVGLLYACLGVGQTFTQLILVKQLVKRYGDSPLVFIGGIIRLVSLTVLVIMATPATSVVALFLFASGTGTQMPALQSLVTTTVDDNRRGEVLGIYQSAVSFALIVGSAIAGMLFEVQPILPYVTGAVIFGIMLVPSFFLMRWAQARQHSLALAGD
jgi:DHA1 family tetracycline resistance protein-like MFS transporter